MSFWTLDNLRSVLAAAWGSVPPPAPVEASGVSTDSRAIAPGHLFIALRGERTDGHLYLDAAARAGAAAALVAGDFQGRLPAGLPVLRVPDTGKGLLRLAAAYRRTLAGGGTRVVAVTGSNGKTTTTRMIDAVLAGGGLRGIAPFKSFNNHVGVPLTILRARPGDHYLVCEVGTNAPGEVAALAEAVAPDVSVIVSVGREHLEKLGSLEQVAREEAAQLEFLRTGGLAVVNADAPFLSEIVAARGGGAGGAGGGAPRAFNVVTFGTRRDADLRVAVTRQDDGGTEFTINSRQKFRLPMLGRHNAVNAAAAAAVGRRFGLEFDVIAAALAKVHGPEMRLDPTSAGGVRVINDAYNANPDSMAAALTTFAELAPGPGRRVLVLGDMLELGVHAESAHTEAVRSALEAGTGADMVVFVGPLMARASRGVRDARVRRVEDPSDEPVARIADLLSPGDTVLLKGSRRMRLERVAEALAARPRRAASA